MGCSKKTAYLRTRRERDAPLEHAIFDLLRRISVWQLRMGHVGGGGLRRPRADERIRARA